MKKHREKNESARKTADEERGRTLKRRDADNLDEGKMSMQERGRILKRKGADKGSQAAERTFFADEQERRAEEGETSHETGGSSKKSHKRARAGKLKREMSAFAAKLGKTKIFVRGSASVRALGAVMKVCPVTDVCAAEDGVAFFVPSKLLNNIVALLDNLCYDYKIIGRYGRAPRLFRAVTRVGLAAGAALFTVLLALYPCFITRVSVSGVAGESVNGALNARIRQILSSYGAVEGKWAPRLDSDAISREILALGGVAYAGVERRGTHLTVLVKQELEGESFWEIKGANIVATRLATVTRVIVEGGTAAVKYGDVVKPGDTLIEGYTLYGDEKIPVEAKGRVYGTTLEKESMFFGNEALIKSYGAVKRITKLGFFGKIPKRPNSPFECCEVRTYRSKIGFLLPIESFTYEFRELVVSKSAEERSDEELVATVYSEILTRLDGEAKIVNVYDDVKMDATGRWVSVTVEAEALISA